MSIKRARLSTAENVIGSGAVVKSSSGRGNYRRRSYYPSRYQKMSRQNFAKLAKQVRTLSAKVKPQVNNYKWKSSTAGVLATVSVTNAAPMITLLNGIGEGTDEVNRIGDLARMNSLDLNVHFYNNSGSNSTPSLVRFLIVQEKTALGSAISMAQLFNSSTPQPWDVFNVTTRDNARFVIHHDESFSLGPAVIQQAGGTAAIYSPANNNEFQFTIKKKFKFVTDYSRGNTGLVGDIDTNSLYFICITDNTIASSVSCDIAWNLCFLD